MKRLFGAVLLLVVALAISLGARPASAQSLNEFTIQDYQIDYYLARDSESHSTLRTEELISAVFSDQDVNHGIERFIPESYDGHSTHLSVSKVTDINGNALPYETYSQDGYTVVRIGDADVYVHGLQTYKIVYAQHDVTRYFADTNDDEFYWDTNGTNWEVPVQSLTARLHVDPKLSSYLNQKQSCYWGVQGATQTCDIVATEDGFTASVTDLGHSENMTIAVGFRPQTFAVYKPTLGEQLFAVWAVVTFVTLPIGMVLMLWFLIRSYRQSERIKEIDIIVPEYVPPQDTSVATAASISRHPTKTFSAQLIDLAVRHYLKIYQTREKSIFRQADYELEIVKDINELKSEERELLTDIFSSTSVGSRLDMESLRNNYAVGIELSDNTVKLSKDIAGKYELRAVNEDQKKWFGKAAKYTFVAGLLTLSPALLITALVTAVISFALKPLTDKGLELARYLKGLEMYIGLAEAERLRFLQSPQGALKLPAPIDTNDKRELVKLYERLLPYAILFGQEKDWNQQLGQYYETLHEQPNWYVGANMAAFNAAAFSSSMSSFSSAVSSTSGGSTGGGSSGGGGGGGGGGGW